MDENLIRDAVEGGLRGFIAGVAGLFKQKKPTRRKSTPRGEGKSTPAPAPKADEVIEFRPDLVLSYRVMMEQSRLTNAILLSLAHTSPAAQDDLIAASKMAMLSAGGPQRNEHQQFILNSRLLALTAAGFVEPHGSAVNYSITPLGKQLLLNIRNRLDQPPVTKYELQGYRLMMRKHELVNFILQFLRIHQQLPALQIILWALNEYRRKSPDYIPTDKAFEYVMDSMLCQAGWLEKDANSYRLKELGRDAYSDFGMI